MAHFIRVSVPSFVGPGTATETDYFVNVAHVIHVKDCFDGTATLYLSDGSLLELSDHYEEVARVINFPGVQRSSEEDES